MSETSLETQVRAQTAKRRLRSRIRFVEPEFAVESYLAYQGQKFVERFDANSYLYITKAIDYFDIGADYGSLAGRHRAHAERISGGELLQRLAVYPRSRRSNWSARCADQGRDVEYHHVQAPFGHDSFLVEVDRMTDVVGGYLNRHWQQIRTE